MLDCGKNHRTDTPIKLTSETLQQIPMAYRYCEIKLIEMAVLRWSLYKPALKVPLLNNPSLQQCYKSLPNFNEQDIEKLKKQFVM